MLNPNLSEILLKAVTTTTDTWKYNNIYIVHLSCMPCWCLLCKYLLQHHHLSTTISFWLDGDHKKLPAKSKCGCQPSYVETTTHPWVFSWACTQISIENIRTPRKHTYICRTPLVTYVHLTYGVLHCACLASTSAVWQQPNVGTSECRTCDTIYYENIHPYMKTYVHLKNALKTYVH